MREIDVSLIRDAVAVMCVKANVELPEDVYQALKDALATETHPRAKTILAMIIDNAECARKKNIPICQDTGFVVCFVDIGQDVAITGGYIEDAINEGIRSGYNSLRKSIVSDPLDRKNTGDNTPAIIHYRIVPGDTCTLYLMPKGGGSENVGKFTVLKPTAHKDEIKKFIVDTVTEAGGNVCPPIIVGVGIGGVLEKTGELAKRSLLRKVGQRNTNKEWAAFEEEVKDAINKTNIGPSGLGGVTTCLDVHVETFPCHIASLPVAVNIQCHAARHAKVEL